LVERKRAQSQLDKLSSSISVIDTHISTIEGTELNRSILETLKASGDALKKLGVHGGIEEVEKVVSEVELQMENAAEVTKVISSANVSGIINSMGHDVITEEELEAELDELLCDDEEYEKPLGMSVEKIKLLPTKVPTHQNIGEASSNNNSEKKKIIIGRGLLEEEQGVNEEESEAAAAAYAV
jgi:hypothetical protein